MAKLDDDNFSKILWPEKPDNTTKAEWHIIRIPNRCLENKYHHPSIPMPNPSMWEEKTCEDCSMYQICWAIHDLVKKVEFG